MRTLFISFLFIRLWVSPGASFASEFEQYAKAGAEFDSHVAAAALRKQLPRLSDPAVAKVFDTLTDHSRFLQGRKLELSDLQNLSEMCAVTKNASAAYASFGLGTEIASSKSAKTKLLARQAAAVDRNTAIFRDEITQLEPFIHRCAAKAVSLLQLFVLNSSPADMNAEQLSGLAQIRYETFARFITIAGMIDDAALSLPTRKKLVETMAEVAPVMRRC